MTKNAYNESKNESKNKATNTMDKSQNKNGMNGSSCMKNTEKNKGVSNCKDSMKDKY